MPPRSKPFGAQVYRANLVVAGIRAAARALRGVASSVGMVPLDGAQRERLEAELGAVMVTFERWDEILTAAVEGRNPCLNDPPPKTLGRRSTASGVFVKSDMMDEGDSP